MKRASYQNGSVVRKERKRGPDVWVFRYFDSDGTQKAEQIGTVDKYKTKAAALKAAVKKREEINDRVACIKVAGLCDRYKDEAMPQRADTASSYRSYLKRLRNDWGDVRLDEMAKDIMAVERWMNELKKDDGGPYSKKTKTNMKWFVHRLFELAFKWGHLSMQRNPIYSIEIKGKNKRVRVQNLITIDQWHKLMGDPDLLPHVRTMIFIAMLLGLRASEILGLRWIDIELENRILWVRRSHVGRHTDDTKTEASEKDLPIHDDLMVVLRDWKKHNTAPDGSDTSVNGWLFGNFVTGRPFWRDSLQQDHLMPAGKKIGIQNLGWHDFRHTYRAIMGEEEIPLEQQKALMRHEDIRTTLGYGGKTKAESLRGANAKVVEMLRKRA